MLLDKGILSNTLGLSTGLGTETPEAFLTCLPHTSLPFTSLVPLLALRLGLEVQKGHGSGMTLSMPTPVSVTKFAQIFEANLVGVPYDRFVVTHPRFSRTDVDGVANTIEQLLTSVKL